MRESAATYLVLSGDVLESETDARAAGAPERSLGLADARQVHAQLKALQACGNEIRITLLDCLRTLHDRGLCYELGYSSFSQYCDRELGLPRSTAYEYVRAATSLDGLPHLRNLFREGELSWEQVRTISRVATAETESEWIELAWTEPVRDLASEVREAQRTHRTAPRRSRHGLPNLLVDLGLKVTLEEKARIVTAFACVSEALDGSTIGSDPALSEQRPPIVRWADAVLAGAIPVHPLAASRSGEGGGAGAGGGRDCAVSAGEADGVGAAVGGNGTGGSAGGGDGRDRAGDPGGTGGSDRAGGPDGAGGAAGNSGGARAGGPGGSGASARRRPSPAQTIVYHTCRECRRSTVETDDGRVSVPPERIDELAPHAKRVVIAAGDEPSLERLPQGKVDAPNSPSLSRQVVHRDGLKCANPACGRRHELQAHHLVFRADGGRTVLSNEVTVCSTCHAMIHDGLLDVRGDLDTGLVWTPRPRNPAVRVRNIEALRARARNLADPIPTRSRATPNGIGAEPRGESGHEPAVGIRARTEWAPSPGHRHESGREPANGDRPMPHGVGHPATTESRHETGQGDRGTKTHGAANPPGIGSRHEAAVTASRVEDLAHGLRRLGFSLNESRECVGQAVVDLLAEARVGQVFGGPPPPPPTDEEILLRALRGRPAAA